MAGRITFPGIGSGIDAESIARFVREQFTLQNIPRKNQVESLGNQNESIGKLRSLLLAVSDRLDSSRTANGGAASKTASSSNTEVLTAAADSTASAGSVSVSVDTLAANASGSFDRTFSSGNDFIITDAAKAGKVTFTVGEGAEATSFDVQVDELTTAEDFVDDFNANSGGKASASLINVGTQEAPQFKISFSTAETGTSKGALSVSADNADLFTDGALVGQTVSQATNAKFTVTGVGTLERSSNTVSDVITGVTLQLKGTGNSTVTIGSDQNAAKAKVKEFVSAFNELNQFIKQEDKVSISFDKGATTNTFGSLSRTNIDEDALSTLRSAVSSARSTDGAVSLASLGVKTERDGSLSFDEKAFEKKFNENPEAVTETIASLADKVSGVQGSVYQLTGYGLKLDTAIKSNESSIASINETISRVERTASQREQGVLDQFTRLEATLAKLNSNSAYLQSILGF